MAQPLKQAPFTIHYSSFSIQKALLVIAAAHAALGRDAKLSGIAAAAKKAVSYLITTPWIYDPVAETLCITSPQSGEIYTISVTSCTRQHGQRCPAAAF